jgi:hypothetical protein
MEMSQADIADRLTILWLKREHRLLDSYAELYDLEIACNAPSECVQRLYEENKRGWDAVQQVTDHFEGRKALLTYDLIQACRAAHESNKARIAIKNEIAANCREALERKTWQ